MFNVVIKPGVFKHVNCRNNLYPKSNINRFPVPDECVFWSTPYPSYAPAKYTSPHVQGQSWADQDLNCSTFQPKWWQLDGPVNRVSYNGTYRIENGVPLNPIGRTGIGGRGLLGRWGPNHAADPVVTKWKRDDAGNIVQNADTQKMVLQLVAIQRRDNKMWAIPGGMVDPGELISTTLMREFMEEALDSFDDKTRTEEFFANGNEIYRGYVDDFRNTDNAWMETVAYNFHDPTGTEAGALKLCAGDDAANVKWIDVDRRLQLHANHIDIIEKVVKLLDAHW